MTLVIRVISHNGRPPETDLSVEVAENSGCSIGRGKENHFILPDAERVVSSKHAYIQHFEGQYYLLDTSTNGTFINSAHEPVGNGNQVAVQAGDVITIGDYQCSLQIIENQPAVATPEPAPVDPQHCIPDLPESSPGEIIPPAVQLDGPQLTDPVGMDWQPEKYRDPLELIGGNPEQMIPDSQPIPESGILSPNHHIPEDVPLGQPAPGSAGSFGAEISPHNEPFTAPEAIPEGWENLSDASASDNHSSKSTPASTPIPELAPAKQPESLLAVEAEPVPAQHIAQPTTEPVIKSPEPTAERPAQTNTASRQTVGGTVNHENTDNLVNIFLQNAGLQNTSVAPEDAEVFMAQAGQLLKEMTQSFKQVLDTRASLKSEFRLGMTTIRPTENNPLKISIDVNDALHKLLFPPSRGYLPPLESVQEASDDLLAHQMAILAGLRAALKTLVMRFDPLDLEKGFQGHSMLDSLLPMSKKARYWELFKEVYTQAAADAENDFMHFLGEEFALAYQDQIARLKNARQSS